MQNIWHTHNKRRGMGLTDESGQLCTDGKNPQMFDSKLMLNGWQQPQNANHSQPPPLRQVPIKVDWIKSSSADKIQAGADVQYSRWRKSSHYCSQRLSQTRLRPQVSGLLQVRFSSLSDMTNKTFTDITQEWIQVLMPLPQFNIKKW